MSEQENNITKTEGPEATKSQAQTSNNNNEMLKESDYTEGAHDPVGEDARRSREKAAEFQKSLKN